MVRPEQDSPAPNQAHWVFRTCERIQAGEVISSNDIAAHLAPQFLESGCDGERMLAVYRAAAPLAVPIESLQTEFERGESISLLTTRSDGQRYRWDFTIEAAPPDRLCGQLWTGPLTATYTDRIAHVPDGDVLVRDYTDSGAGSKRLLLLHCRLKDPDPQVLTIALWSFSRSWQERDFIWRRVRRR